MFDRFIISFLVLVFAFAGLDKAAHIHGFINALDGYVVLPFPVGSILAPFIIAAELAIAAGLVVKRWRRIAASQAAGLMILFTLALAVNRLRGAEKICGCWFSINTAQGNVHFVFNAILIALCLIVWASEKSVATQGCIAEADDSSERG